MESENPSGLIAFNNQLTKAEFPDSSESCLEENRVKIESDPVNSNDKCPSPRLLRSQKRKKGCSDETLNKYIVSADEEEPLKRRRKKYVPTQKQKERYCAYKRAKVLSEEQKEHRNTRRRMLYKINTPRIKAFDENLSGEFAFDNHLTNADASNKCIVSTDEQEPRRPRRKKRVVTQEQKERYKAMSRVEGLSDEQLQHKRAYAREKYKRRSRQIQEQRKLEEKSKRIEALAKVRQESKALQEQLKHTADRDECIKLRRKISRRKKKEKNFETAIDSNLEQLPRLRRKGLPLTPEQHERKRLYDIEYKLKRKQKKMDNALNKPLENESEAK